MWRWRFRAVASLDQDQGETEYGKILFTPEKGDKEVQVDQAHEVQKAGAQDRGPVGQTEDGGQA